MKRFPVHGTILTAIFALATVSFGQVSPPAKDNKDNKVFNLRFNLLALDDKDRIISGVRAEDIKIFENGVEQKLTYFSAKAPPVNISLVIDNSGSVSDQLDDMTQISKQIVENLRSFDSADIIRFVGRDKVEIIQSWTSRKPDLTFALDALFVEGGQTAFVDAVYLAAADVLKRRAMAKDERYAIVVLSDCEDRASYYKRSQLLTLLADTDVQIFTVTVGNDIPKKDPNSIEGKRISFIRQNAIDLSTRTGGASFFISSRSKKDDSEKVLRSLMSELRSQFVVGYTAEGVNQDTRLRKLSATVTDGPNGEKRKAVIREIIIVPFDK